MRKDQAIKNEKYNDKYKQTRSENILIDEAYYLVKFKMRIGDCGKMNYIDDDTDFWIL